MPAESTIRIIIGVSGRHRRSLMKNLILSNVPPCEGYIVEVDGKFESEYGTLTGALKAGLELREKFPHNQVKVYDAKERTRTVVELSQ
jgi:hypothetical protein